MKTIKFLSVIIFSFAVAACGGGDNGATFAVSPLPGLTTGQAAAVVVGQADFVHNASGGGATGLNLPYTGVFISGGKLYISDTSNNRVLVYNNIPAGSGASADYALGQSNLNTTTSGTSDTTMNYPQSAMISGGKLFVAEYQNNRISIYNTVPTTSPGTIDVVAGQADKSSKVPACSSTGLSSPGTVWVSGSKMVVADSAYNRVLIWNNIPTGDGIAADLVLGQASMTSCDANAGGTVTANSLSSPGGVWTDGTRLVVNDSGNNRVLIWNSFPTGNGQAADLVLGQADFTSDLPNRGGAASAVTMNGPLGGAFFYNGLLLVADNLNNRVLIWNIFPTVNGQAANRVLGQSNFISTSAGTSATTLNGPSGVYVFDTQLFVTDSSNNRVLIYNGN